jgi:hypothetical protein
MFNPVYFNYGIAVHGAKNVPLQPASHGCIRIHMELSKTFPSLVKNGNRVYVWGQDGREPESYSRARRSRSSTSRTRLHDDHVVDDHDDDHADDHGREPTTTSAAPAPRRPDRDHRVARRDTGATRARRRRPGRHHCRAADRRRSEPTPADRARRLPSPSAVSHARRRQRPTITCSRPRVDVTT